MAREPFPLQWPAGWKRTGNRNGAGSGTYQAKFQANFAQDRDSIIRQLKRRGSRIVITSDLPTRGDGLPYASATCSDPGIAVYWVERGNERVIACDRWNRVALNLRAIEMSLEAMRGLDRWGAAEMVERAFSGFTALPAAGETSDGIASPSPPPVVRPWREVLGRRTHDLTTRNADPWPADLEPDELLALAKSRHRKMIQVHHPDRGGDAVIAAEINAALAAAEKELAS